MKKQEYLDRLEKLKLDKNRYCVISGGVLLVYGLKDTTSDIDIKIRPDYFEELKSIINFKKSPKLEYDDLYEIDDDIEVAVRDYDDADVRMVDGCPVESLELTMQWWIDHNRPKDQEKIQLVKDYLEANL